MSDKPVQTLAKVREAINDATGTEPDINLTIHGVTDETAQAIVESLPELLFKSGGTGSTEWIESARSESVKVTLFFESVAPISRSLSPRADAVMARVAEARQ